VDIPTVELCKNSACIDNYLNFKDNPEI